MIQLHRWIIRRCRVPTEPDWAAELQRARMSVPHVLDYGSKFVAITSIYRLATTVAGDSYRTDSYLIVWISVALTPLPH